MKFKIDENLPVEVAELVREAEHDVFTVLEQELGGAKDQIIVEICQKEKRALVTLDTHFAYIRAYPPADFPGIIVLRLIRQDKKHVLGVINRILAIVASRSPEGQLWIVDEQTVRIRT